jgi:thymidine kinase
MLAEEAIAAAQGAEKPKRLILVAMDKGGVGKSFFTILLTQWLHARRHDFLAFDPDYHNSTLTRFVPESQFLDIRHSENLDRIIEVMQEHPLVLVDGVGSQQRIFLDWLEETNLLQLRHAMRLELTLVLIVEEDKDTVHQAGEAVSRIGNQVDWLVVKNQKSMTSTRIYDQSKARKELLGCGAKEMTMPKMTDHLVVLLQQHSLTIDRALEGDRLFLIDRQRLVDYRKSIFSHFEANQSILLS